MIHSKNLYYYILIVGLFLILKAFHSTAANSDLKFLLFPTTQIVDLATDSESDFYEDMGFVNSQLNIVIDKSCSGFNFLILCFVCLSFTAIGYFNKNLYKSLSIVFLLIISYFLTIFANSSRILVSVSLQKLQILNITKQIHQAEGVFVYLFFLIAFYLIFLHILNKKND